MNLILWSQIHMIAHMFGDLVEEKLEKSYFADIQKPDRRFSVFGYLDNGMYWGGGKDGTNAQNLCGYAEVAMSNIYGSQVKKHFGCGHNISTDEKIQLAIRSIDGLPVEELTDPEKEQAAKAIAEGYLYREGDMLYTKILVIESGMDRCAPSYGLEEVLLPEADSVAEEMTEFLKKTLPSHLIAEYRYANALAALPIFDTLIEALIDEGLLIPPENGIGAEGCWMITKR
jgi:hypothetical protein